MKKSPMETYIRWRGDLSFSQAGFNDVDNLIFSALSYLDFSPVFTDEKTTEMKLKDCADIIEQPGAYRLKTLEGGYEDTVKAILRSRRFGEITVREYCEIFSEEDQTQFSACEFVIDGRTSYVSFRGTDNTIIGWKEDFILSYSLISSQKYAEEYLKKVMRPLRKYYVGGHSKGGNLALFACAMLDAKKRKKLIKVYANDSPGFSPEVLDIRLLEPLADRIVRINPAFCVIGRIFEIPYGRTEIVDVNESGLLQHDLFLWKLMGTGYEDAEGYDKVSDWVSRSIKEWIENIDPAERRIFVDDVFNTLSAGGAVTVQEITGKGLMKVITTAYSGTSDTTKKLIKDLVSAAALQAAPEKAGQQAADREK